MLTCEKCGNEIKEYEKFCHNCGNVISIKENIETNDISDSDGTILRIMEEDKVEDKSSKIKKSPLSIKIYLALLIPIIAAFVVIYYTNQEKKNAIGNNFHNSILGGKVAQQGDWIYYSNNGAIYKARAQGGTPEKIVNEPYYRNLSVVGDYIYCNGYDGNIYRIGINDKSVTSLLDINDMKKLILGDKDIGGIICVINAVTDKEIYFSTFTYLTDNLYRMDLQGKNIKKIAGGSYRVLHVDEKYMYCINYSEWVEGSNNTKIKIIRYTRDGYNPEVLHEDTVNSLTSVCIDEDFLYFVSEGSKLYQYNLKSKEKKMVLDKVPELDVTVEDGWIYYVKDNSIYRMEIGKNQAEKISQDTVDSVYGGFYIFDKYIFYTNDKNDYIIMKTDGSDKVAIKSSEH